MFLTNLAIVRPEAFEGETCVDDKEGMIPQDMLPPTGDSDSNADTDDGGAENDEVPRFFNPNRQQVKLTEDSENDSSDDER